MPRKPLTAPAKLQRQCDTWNWRYPVGTDVILRAACGTLLDTTTTTKATVKHGLAVVRLKGIAEAVPLDPQRMEPTRPRKPLRPQDEHAST